MRNYEIVKFFYINSVINIPNETLKLNIYYNNMDDEVV